MIKLNLFWQILLRLWVIIKGILGKLFGRIGRLAPELDFVYDIEDYEFINQQNRGILLLTFNDKSTGSITYKVDKLGKLVWDYQFDSINLYKRGYGDCNNLHRLIQVFNYIHSDFEEVYLVHYITKPFKLSHGTVLAKKFDEWYVLDYNTMLKVSSLEQALTYLGERYKVKEIRAFVLQDISWKFIKESLN